jgi:hypothetical protein
MFVKITRSAGRAYVKLVEAYRDDSGAPRQRVVATLGRLEQVRAGGADALVRGLRRVAGEQPDADVPRAVEDGRRPGAPEFDTKSPFQTISVDSHLSNQRLTIAIRFICSGNGGMLLWWQ